MKFVYPVGQEKKLIRCPICGGCEFEDHGSAFSVLRELRCDTCGLMLHFEGVEPMSEDNSDSL